jgi:hypothetical protein
MRADVLAMRTAALREHEALEDKERREAGWRFTVVHPPTLLREYGTTMPPQRYGIRAGVARLQDWRFRAGKGRWQCSCLSWRILAETFATPRHNGPWPVQGRNQDCRVRLHAITPPGVDSTSLKEPRGAYPRKCSFIYHLNTDTQSL